MIKSKVGFFLPYTMFIFILVLNIFIFIILCSLNTNRYYEDKDNYYQIFILEERAKRHITYKITNNLVSNFYQEQVFYDEDFLFLTYEFNESEKLWTITIRIYHKFINEFAQAYYDIETKELTYIVR